MIIDIDNFKEVNDGLGHLFGDAVLSDIARRMKKIFHHRDLSLIHIEMCIRDRFFLMGPFN